MPLTKSELLALRMRAAELLEEFAKPSPGQPIWKRNAMKLLAGLILAVLPFAAIGQNCAEFEDRIDRAQRTLGIENAVGSVQSSSATDLARWAKVNAQLQVIQILMIQMQALKCPLPKEPIDATGSVYASDIVACSTVLMKRNNLAGAVPPECDTSRWRIRPSVK